MIYIGADHRGYEFKEIIKNYLKDEGYSFEDVGNSVIDEGDDYVDFAKNVSEKVLEKEDNKGILICGSGIGVDIVANKFKGIRSGLCSSPEQARAGRNDDDINVLSMGADFIEEDEVLKIIEKFINTDFSKEERFSKRIEKIADIGAGL